MSGRKPIKLYEYTLDGILLKVYDTNAEFRKKQYPEQSSRRGLYFKKELGINYLLTKNNTIVFKIELNSFTFNSLMSVINFYLEYKKLKKIKK